MDVAIVKSTNFFFIIIIINVFFFSYLTEKNAHPEREAVINLFLNKRRSPLTKKFFFSKFFFNFFFIFFYKILVQIDTVNGRKASPHCTLVGKASAHWTERPQISAKQRL